MIATRQARRRAEPIHRVIIEPEEIPAAQAIAPWLAWHSDIGTKPRTRLHNETVLRCFLTATGLLAMPVCRITAGHVSGWLNRDCPDKLSTRKNNLSVINSFFEFANSQGWVIGVPSKEIRRIKMEKLTHNQIEPRQRRPFTDAEVNCLLKFIESQIVLDGDGFTLEFWRAAVAIGRWAGLRLGDIATLEWHSLDTHPGYLWVYTDKSDTLVKVPVAPELAPFLAAIKRRHKLYCFPEVAKIGQHLTHRAKLSIWFARLLKKCGLAGHIFHELRYTFIRDCKQKGMAMPHIAELVGHASTETTNHYANITK